MADFVEISGGYDLKNGEMKMFNVGGREILLARDGDNFWFCLHLVASLFIILLL
jgi:hypothetical protein